MLTDEETCVLDELEITCKEETKLLLDEKPEDNEEETDCALLKELSAELVLETDEVDEGGTCGDVEL